MSFHALATRLLGAAQTAFGTTAADVDLRLWWKATPSATTFTVAMTGSMSTPPAADSESAQAAFERGHELILFNVPVTSFATLGRLPYKDEVFQAGYSTTSSGSDVKKYIVSKVTRHPVMAHYHIEAFLTS